MSKEIKTNYRIETLAVRAGQVRTPEGEHSEAIFPTSSFVFESAQQAAKRFSGEEKGNIYSRFTNPTVRNFEERLAAMEGAERCIATASGMSAIFSICLAHLKAGDHVLCSQQVFGTTVGLFSKYLNKFGVQVSFVNLLDLNAWQQAIQDNTRLLFLETPTNPLVEVADIKAFAEFAHKHSALLVVDNCFCTPVLQQPLALGADIVVHSATKFIDGQGRCIGGAVAGSEKLMEEVYGVLRTTGQTLSPFNAWVFLKGLETLSIRMKAHCENAQVLAEWLNEQQAIEKVYYCGLSDHPQHDLAKSQQSGFGAVLSFDVKGDRDNAWKVIDACQLISITTNLGDAKSTISHPATTSHGRLSDAEREQCGIKQNLIRVSVGLENIEDIKNDLALGLALIF
jgi:O-succinylhomoserine sulfhydrylase